MCRDDFCADRPLDESAIQKKFMESLSIYNIYF